LSGLLEVLEQSRALGFLGPGPVADHVAQADAYLAALPHPPSRYLDLGSGGGAPGLVLAVAWPTAVGTLLDAQLRRVRFLEEAVTALGLADRIDVVHGRAEELAWDDRHRGSYEVVTARSFGPPAITAECGAGFLTEGGCLLVAEPPGGAPRADGPARWDGTGLAQLGLADAGVVSGPTSSVQALTSVAGPQPGVPRRMAALRRSPRF
jgi:16S rRNA (guanine527-N7)-methyltransferase